MMMHFIGHSDLLATMQANEYYDYGEWLALSDEDKEDVNVRFFGCWKTIQSAYETL
jgi:hypothetical protein